MRRYKEVVTTPSSAVTTFSSNDYTQACTAVDSAAPSCCVQQAIGQVQAGCGGISFDQYTICQQNSNSPTSMCGSRRAGGEMWKSFWRRAKVTAPLVWSPRYSGKCVCSSSHEELIWDNHGVSIYNNNVSQYTTPPPPPHRHPFTPRGLLDRKLSARLLVLCLRLRMHPLSSPNHTSLVAAKTESTPSSMIATVQSKHIISLCVCSLPVYTHRIPEQRKIIWMHLRRGTLHDEPWDSLNEVVHIFRIFT